MSNIIPIFSVAKVSQAVNENGLYYRITLVPTKGTRKLRGGLFEAEEAGVAPEVTFYVTPDLPGIIASEVGRQSELELSLYESTTGKRTK